MLPVSESRSVIACLYADVYRLNEMMDVYRVHVHERDDIESRMEASQARIEALTGDSGGLEERYRYFHEMRGYVQDVIECFAEKV